MIKLLISFILFFSIYSCNKIEKKELKEIIIESKDKVQEKFIKQTKTQLPKKNNIYYYIGESYFIEGVKYIPEENYNYSEEGLATFYGKELHNIKTVNNDYNKVTELLGRHKTLPLPSLVKITNLENGLSINVKIIDRHQDNVSIIQVSRKVAQLLGFYKNKLAKVRVDIISDASKQWKSVSNSLNEPDFDKTVNAAPTDIVSISNIEDESNNNVKSDSFENPIEIGSEEVTNVKLFLKVYEFNNYEEAQSILDQLNLSVKNTIESEGSYYNLIIGPITNELGNNLVSSFIMKGYKKTELIFK